MRATGERIVSTGNLTVSTKGLQCLLSAGRVVLCQDLVQVKMRKFSPF